MKSAYELAMERLEKESPSAAPLTNVQKAEIAEIQQKAEAKIAEIKILAKDEMKKAGGDMQILQEIKANMQNDIRREEEACSQKKQAVRDQK